MTKAKIEIDIDIADGMKLVQFGVGEGPPEYFSVVLMNFGTAERTVGSLKCKTVDWNNVAGTTHLTSGGDLVGPFQLFVGGAGF